MKEIKKDLFECISDPETDAICITTNGMYGDDGKAFMGGGCARVCADRWPQTALRLGKCLKNFETNIPFIIGSLDAEGNYIEPNFKTIKSGKFKCLIFSFPTIDNLMDGSKIELIKNSAIMMMQNADRFFLKKIVTVRFGSGIGGLNWYKEVKPAIENILDDRFIICCQENDEFYE